MPRKGLHRLGKRKALDFYQIVQSRLADDPAGEPIPFTVADFQAVMLTGAVGVTADVYQFIWVTVSQIGQQVDLLGLRNLFRRDKAHYSCPRRWSPWRGRNGVFPPKKP